jgi:tRNA1Val (adenine37-N6)-methyltransferase
MRSKDSFRFKQFTVRQDRCAMKVGTDGVLLGAWAETGGARSILDVGTGTGLIALMLAQRTGSDTRITSIEIDSEAARQAGENFSSSPWFERLDIVSGSFPEALPPEARFDLIVSNPPYFSGTHPSKSPEREAARNSDFLPLTKLVAESAARLNPSGRLALILPFDQKDELISLAEKEHLYPCRMTDVVPAPGKLPKRWLVEFSFAQSSCVSGELCIETGERHQYSPEFRRLTESFYL